jgi:hypothetical protein
MDTFLMLVSTVFVLGGPVLIGWIAEHKTNGK